MTVADSWRQQQLLSVLLARDAIRRPTGAEIEIPAKKSVKFKTANDLQGVVQ
ncbi:MULTISPECIES: HU family DNA-binding protein [Acidithiobacillus]|uniref:HU family DNA-binding protein n=1 Tax=Acidithiobacillus TaxID=119977 RepID=UPI000B02ACD3|nr:MULTISPECIES: HU family DNA-binding protein [Acidithiobacillus]MEB8487771.1 hypothetical protein [Acidithiobacillus ferriphilus]MEB8493931.1 hypothetical protein [Acidithiobacillus ferriphilus]MEB8521316.1 hypothetical protein [Acidithiobacillus ferriphilus]MEB8531880.1 hypothetical protein [Acidithiobacillus ferriphilus]MEB8556870.1 hypothetical protein [Acidithiobacillus ferriphilus]